MLTDSVASCRRCKRLFNDFSNRQVCPVCREQEEQDFQRVKAYVQDHKGCSIQEVVAECDVDTRQIHQWIKEERLEFMSGCADILVCEKCGGTVISGRFCDKCKAEMIQELGQYTKTDRLIQKPTVTKEKKDMFHYANKKLY